MSTDWAARPQNLSRVESSRLKNDEEAARPHSGPGTSSPDPSSSDEEKSVFHFLYKPDSILFHTNSILAIRPCRFKIERIESTIIFFLSGRKAYPIRLEGNERKRIWGKNGSPYPSEPHGDGWWVFGEEGKGLPLMPLSFDDHGNGKASPLSDQERPEPLFSL